MDASYKWTRLFLALFTVNMLKKGFGSNECPDLAPGSNMLVSETVGWVGDEPVTVSCEEGHILDILVLQKNISCIAGENTAVWSESIGSCQKKQCNNASTITSTNMAVVNDSSVVYYYGDNVTIECEEGYAFDADNVVTTKKTIYCENNATSTIGMWGYVDQCQLITCDKPPEVDKSIMVYNSTTYNSTVVYQCLSGYGFGTERFHLTATCNGSANWIVTQGSNTELGNKKCAKMRKYIGCVQNGSIVSEVGTEDVNNGILFCIGFCKDNDKRFAAVHNSTCSCGNEVVVDYQTADDSDCNMQCPGYDAMDSSQQVFCGGLTGEMELYVTLDGCYKSVDLLAIQAEVVTEHKEITCREMCRGKDVSHAALQDGNVCYCINTTSIVAVETDTNKCSNTSFYNTTNIFDLERLNNMKSTCSALYETGVRLNGEYYLKNQDNKETCYFKDGTICENGWVGFDGYCYYFNDKTKMDFSEARHYCIALDADLVSINSESEFEFLKDTRTKYEDLWADTSDPKWWLGLVDMQNTSLYMWLDGSIGTYSNFDEAPDDVTNHLAVDHAEKDYLWYETNEEAQHNVMCKKPKDGPHCASVSALSPDYTMSHAAMSLTYCVQVCKGQQIEYAVIQNNTCNCVNSMLPLVQVPKPICNTTCPGNVFQYCGGNLSTYSVLKVSEKQSAKSCEELQLVGIDDNTFLVQADDTTTLFRHCGVSGCPFSWISLNGHCFKYMPYAKTIAQAIEICAAEDAYMVSIETETEIEDVIMAATNISLYSAVESWKVGLMGLSMNGGLYRWSNGKMSELTLWNNSATGLDGTVVTVQAPNYHNWQAKKANKDHTKFICEKGLDYTGCYSNIGMSWDVTIHEYSGMTIQQCVEFCRPNYRQYAFLNSTSCSCESSLTPELPSLCTTVCSGQDNQICGGSNVMSVYDVDEYPSFANNCTDLFLAGIFLSGTYIISGTETTCNFTDGTSCVGDGWIGIEGNCYKHFPKEDHSRYLTCHNNDAVQTSLTSFAEYKALVQYVRRINFHGNTFRVFTGITHGGYDLDVFISQDGFLTDYNLLTNGHLIDLDLHDSFGYISFRIDHRHTHNSDGGVVCKENKHIIGCFEVPVGLLPVLENFGSVELTLCRQLCIARGENITLIGMDFCACISETELSTFTPTSQSSCDVHCNVHANQLCGNGSVLWAHYSGIDDFQYGESCFHLYKSGIFYSNTFRLKSHDPTVPYETKQCGFVDNTTCPIAWLGNDGMCYKIVEDHLSFSNALQHCANLDSYLFNPVNEGSINFVSRFINTSGLLSDSIWWTGIAAVFYNTSYMSANGLLVLVDHSIDDSIPTSNAVFHSDTLVWTAPSSTNGKHPVICQKDKDFLGCQQIASVPDAQYKDYAGNSVTQCIFWCNGQDCNFAAIYSHDCACFDGNPSMSTGNGKKCNVACDGGMSQSCGGVDVDENVYHSVYNITDIEGVAGSCEDLLKHGISKPGEYNLRHSDLAPYIKTSCFQFPDPLDYLQSDIKLMTASSTLSGHAVENLKLVVPFTNAWKPSKNDASEYVKIILNTDYLVTGIIISGLHTHDEQSFLKSYRLQYRDLLLGTLQTYSVNGSDEIESGCKDSSELCFCFLSEPLITNEIRVFPMSWHNSISLQLALAGQPYTSFNHSDTYIGCAVDPEPTVTAQGVVSGIDDCIDVCQDNFMPLASLDATGNCSCGNGDLDHGFVDDSYCPLHTNGHDRTGSRTFRAFYRTFYKHCEAPEPNAVYHGHISVTTPTSGIHGLFTYNTTVTYTCDTGYELPDGTREQDSVCLQSNQWSDLITTCSIVSCAEFSVTNGDVGYTSLTYGGAATVTCDHGYWADNNEDVMIVHCNDDKQWSLIPTCTVDNLRQKQRHFSISTDTVRETSAIMNEVRVRSKLDCAAKCTEDYYCKAANFKNDEGGKDGGTCRLFLQDSDFNALSGDLEWNYLAVAP